MAKKLHTYIMKTCAIIPVYNEERHIKKVIEITSKHIIDVLVIDDGSTDNTPNEIAKTPVRVFRHPKNLGKGEALKSAFKLTKDYEAIIIIDGDCQHDPDEIPNFLKMVDHYDLIIGSREKRKSMPLINKISNNFSTWIISRLAHQKILDSQSGYRLMKRRLIDSLDLKTTRFETETEIIIQAAKKGFKIGHLPIKTIYQTEKSHFHKTKDTLRFIKYFLKAIFIKS